ncbi:MAG: hypothetical protein IJT23_08520 [Clostridia bacterium]|nr:hypothetical protein [Clostridia bacterium]
MWSIGNESGHGDNHYEMLKWLRRQDSVFRYTAKEKINERLYSMYVEQFQIQGDNEYHSQIKALRKIAENGIIDFKEV